MPPSWGWLAVGALADQPVWINLTATGGIGLDGAGATDAARTLLAALLGTAPAATVVTDHHTAATLLAGPPQHLTEQNGEGRQALRDPVSPPGVETAADARCIGRSLDPGTSP